MIWCTWCCAQQLADTVVVRNVMYGTDDGKMLSCSPECFVFLSSVQTQKLNIYETVFIAVLHVCETWVCILKDEH